MSFDTKKSFLKILITGGAGFIGSALIRQIIDETNFSIVNVDKLTYAGSLQSIATVSNNPRYIFKQIDICNHVELKKIFKDQKPDIIMHLAAESHVDRSIDKPSDFIKSNIIGTYTLLELGRDYWNTLKGDKKKSFRFIHISTDEVYGDLPHPDHKDGSLPLFTEISPYKPSSPYSASKASSDHLVRAWNRTYDFPTIVTNCSNNYGPYHYPEKLIPMTILNALEAKPIPVYAKGNQIRDWLYVYDHVKALLLVATKGKIGETYNIGGNNEKKNIEVVKGICAILEEMAPLKDSSLKITKYENLIKYVKDRPGHDMRYAIDASKIKKELGWKPLETFETGIKKTVRWYLDNPSWYKKL